MRTWVRGGAYFALVFSVGFALGVVRVLFVAPRLGEANAEILEAPLMILASFVCARVVVRRDPSATRRSHLASGLVALALLLLFEFTVVLGLREMTFGTYLASRDPVAGTVYLLSLLAFAAMPWWVSGPVRD